MGDLLDIVIEAHGGLERWNQLNNVSARLIQGGALWALKGQVGVLDDVVVTADDAGFLLTGSDLQDEDLAEFDGDRPLFLETSRPGIFAVGDVHSGSIKRVASAVGEGSTAVRLIHQRLDDLGKGRIK
jgi:thioredoxin reductase (NADPH)